MSAQPRLTRKGQVTGRETGDGFRLFTCRRSRQQSPDRKVRAFFMRALVARFLLLRLRLRRRGLEVFALERLEDARLHVEHTDRNPRRALDAPPRAGDEQLGEPGVAR